MTPISTITLPARHDSAAARELALEHGALTRQLAGLQRRMSEQVRAQALQLTALEEEVLSLRGELIVTRTCMLWGLGAAGVARAVLRRPRAPVVAAEDPMAEASSVICQTGCVGHAYPWLEADGQCRRTGVTCNQIPGLAEDPI